jgi:hypothetical protein
MACCTVVGDRPLVAALAMMLMAVVAAQAQAAPLDLETIAQLGDVDPALAPRLNQRVRCTFDDASLLDALTELSVSYSVPIKLDPSVEPILGQAPHLLGKLSGVRLATVLDFLTRQADLSWLTRAGAVWIVTAQQADAARTWRSYPLGPLLRAVHDRRFTRERTAQLITQVAAPTVWDDVGGPCTAGIVGSALRIDAYRQVHAEVARALVELEHAYDLRPGEPLRRRSDDNIRRRLQAARVTFEANRLPLVEVCRRFAEETHVSFLIDTRCLSDAGVDVKAPVKLGVVSDLTVDAALTRLLAAAGLTWFIDNETVLITTRVEAESMLDHRYFKVADFAAVPPGPSGNGEDALAAIITSLVGPTSWDDVGGPGTIAVLPRVLLIAQTQELLDEIGQMLARLRGARNGDPRAARGIGSRRERLEAVLRQPVSVRCTSRRLDAVIASLRQQYAVPIDFDPRVDEVEANADSLISLDVNDVPLASVLGLLLEPLDLAWVIRNETIVVTSRGCEETSLDLEIHDVSDLLRPLGGPRAIDHLMEIVSDSIAPTTWDLVGGPGSMAHFGDLLLVSQTRPVRAGVTRLLDDLRTLYGLPRQAPAERPAGFKARRGLATLVGFDFQKTPLRQALDELSRQSHTPIVIETNRLAEGGVRNDTPVDLWMTRARLRFALDRLLRPLELTWVIRHDVLFVTSKDAADDMLTTKVFPLPSSSLASAGQTAAAIRSETGRDRWDEAGGPGSISAVPRGLVVSQTRDVLEAIERWLALRSVAGQALVRIEE